MLTSVQAHRQKIIKRKLLIQIFLICVLYFIASLTTTVSTSIFIGLLVAFVPQVVFNVLLFYKESIKIQPQNYLSNLYKAESIKIILTIILFALVFLYLKNINVLYFILSFVFFIIMDLVLTFLLNK